MSNLRPSDLSQEKVILFGIGIVILCVIGAVAFSQWRANHQATTKLPATAPLSIDLGNPDNENTVVVYTDPTCDKCAAYHEDVIKKLYEDQVKSDKINLQIRPLGIVSATSVPLVELMMCSSEQDAYVQTTSYISDALFADGKYTELRAAAFFSDHKINDIAAATDMNASKLTTCLDDTRYENKVQNADDQAYAANVYSTPTTFVGDKKGEEPVRGYASSSYIDRLVELRFEN